MGCFFEEGIAMTITRRRIAIQSSIELEGFSQFKNNLKG